MSLNTSTVKRALHMQVNKPFQTNNSAQHALLSRSCSSMHNTAEAVRLHQKLLSINNSKL